MGSPVRRPVLVGALAGLVVGALALAVQLLLNGRGFEWPNEVVGLLGAGLILGVLAGAGWGYSRN